MDTASTRPAPEPPILLDLGKRKRKLVKKLRQGEGELMGEIEEAIAQLRASGDLAADARAVIVVVREKPKKDAPFARLLG